MKSDQSNGIIVPSKHCRETVVNAELSLHIYSKDFSSTCSRGPGNLVFRSLNHLFQNHNRYLDQAENCVGATILRYLLSPPQLPDIGYLLLPSRVMTELRLKRRKSSKQSNPLQYLTSLISVPCGHD